MILLRSQKNDLFDKVISKNISPSLIDIIDASRSNKIVFKIKNEDFFFQLSLKNLIFTALYYPGKGSQTLSTNIQENEWTTVLFYFDDWLQNIKPQITQPDKWEEFFNSKKFVDLNYLNSATDDQFTFEEIIELELSMQLIKNQIHSLNLSQQQNNEISKRLDYLVEKAKQLNKIDWKNILIGTLISIPIQLAFTPQNSQTFFSICKIAFQKVLLLIF